MSSLTPEQDRAAADLFAVPELLLFTPTPVFAGLMHDSAGKVLLRAANDTGKTYGLSHLVSDRLVRVPGLKARFVGPTRHHTHTVAGEYLAQFLGPYLHPKSYYTEGQGWNGGRAKTIRLSNGSFCELLSQEDKPKAHEGAKLDLVVIDEPPTEAHLAANLSRVRDGGQLFIAATMVNQPVDFLRRMAEGEDGSPTHGRTLHSTGWVQYVARMCKEDCPFHSDEYIARRIADASLSPWQYEQRINGGWEGESGGRRFVRFGADNVSEVGPSGKASIMLTMDHGETRGHQHVLLCAFRGTKLWVVDEYWNETIATPKEDAAGILRMLRLHGIRPTGVDLAVGDINTAGKSGAGWHVNEAIAAAMALHLQSPSPPFRIINADKSSGSVRWGEVAINYAAGNLDLMVHPRCARLISALRNWEGSRAGKDGEYSHACDALRYGLLAALGEQAEYARLRFV